MISRPSPAHCNRHIETLQRAFEQAQSPVDCLIIAHNDPQTVSSLSAALVDETAAVLQVSQDTWDFDGQDLPEAIEWAVSKTTIKFLVLVGHLRAGSPPSRASLTGRTQPDGIDASQMLQSSYDRLKSGTVRVQQQVRKAQQRLAEQINQLMGLRAVRTRLSNGELGVFGLFYRPDSGVFLHYDVRTGAFHPLIKH